MPLKREENPSLVTIDFRCERALVSGKTWERDFATSRGLPTTTPAAPAMPPERKSLVPSLSSIAEVWSPSSIM